MMAGMTIFLGWLDGVPEILPLSARFLKKSQEGIGDILDLNSFSVGHIPINIGCSRHGLHISVDPCSRSYSLQ
jgi:hypothetical protein